MSFILNAAYIINYTVTLSAFIGMQKQKTGKFLKEAGIPGKV